jgi:serine/threonine-protein kinase RsbT
MNDNITWAELARVPIAKMQDVLLARFVGRDEATKMGFPPAVLTRLTTAISEITRNVVQHAGCAGDIQIGRIADGDKVGLRIIVSDKGKGIEQPERFLSEGKLSALGAGLPGTRKLVDQFDIKSAPGAGTTVTIEFWKRATKIGTNK